MEDIPYVTFKCVDGQQIPIKDCLKECRLKDTLEAGRCLSKRTLIAMSQQREWTGIPSTTQLLRGTREAYLTIKKEFSVDPQSMMFAIHGTNVHEKLDEFTPEGCMGEERLYDENSSGSFDFYDPEDGGVLYDTKTYGSFQAAKVMGITDKYIPDGVYKSGDKKGQVKWKKIRVQGRKKRFDLAVQLNDYRMKLESKGHIVGRLVCEILVKDGGLFVALNRGIDFTGKLIVVNKISDRWVNRYMAKKSRDLINAINNDEMPPICKPRERWYDGKKGVSTKCQRFCNVAEFCDFGRGELSKAKGDD